MTLTHTFVKVGESIGFADPYKICNDCGGWIDGVISFVDGRDLTLPCEHAKGYRDACPSWGPVDGCLCMEHLGYVPHPARPDRA